MKTAYWLPLLAVAAFAADCEGDIFETDTDPGTEATFEFIINSVNVTCAGTNVTADAMFGGWAETVTLDIANTGDPAFDGGFGSIWDETHVFPAEANIAFAEDGSTDTWQLVLPIVGINDQVDGSSTFLDCSFYDTDGTGDTDSRTYDSTAFRLSATPDDTAEADQCAIFGHESAQVTAWAGCECFEAFFSDPVVDSPCDPAN